MVSAGLLITDGEKFLVELPLHQTPGEHHFDLPKGHVEDFDSDFRGTAFREAKEETGYDFDSYKDRAYALCNEPVSYIKGKQIYGSVAFWIDENIAEAWKPARNNMRLVEIFMLLSMIIALLGLVAMSTYYADGKSRDIAVRKVFGGTVDSEAWKTIRDYMVLVGIACVIGIPIAVYAAQEYLKDYIYRLERSTATAKIHQ